MSNTKIMDKEAKIGESIRIMENKGSKILFCVPNVITPNSSVYEIYFHANVMKNAGYDVYMLTDPEFELPYWIEAELLDLKHLTLSNSKLNVNPHDIMIIPEIYSNIMESTKNLPCLRVGFLQSFDYMLSGLIPGMKWDSFNIKNVITISDKLKNMFHDFYGKDYNIKKYDIGIPDYFKRTNIPKKPIVSIVSRNANDVTKIAKLFYSKYPHFSWVSFDTMLTDNNPPKPTTREGFAKRLDENFLAVWIDRISSFGTFPLECMMSKTIPICFKPDILPDYLYDSDGKYNVNCGIWIDDLYEIPNIIAEAVYTFMDDGEYFDKDFDVNILNKYRQNNSSEEIRCIYEEFINERISFFKNALEESNKNNENNE